MAPDHRKLELNISIKIKTILNVLYWF